MEEDRESRRVMDSEGSPNKNKNKNNNIENDRLVNEKSSENPKLNPKAKSCKGCLYYSSTLKSNSRNPVCVGIARALPQVPRYYVGESEAEASKEGRSLTDFKYGCVGYSIYSDVKTQSGDIHQTPKELPVCVGIEALVDRRVVNADSTSAHVHNKDGHGIPHQRNNKPAHSVGDDFLSRFSRNANLVATGVAKNVRKVGNQIKESVDDILYPYRRRPK